MRATSYIVGMCLCAVTCLEAFPQQATREQILKLFYQAQQAKQTGAEEDAIACYKQIINLVPRLPDPYLQLGDIYGKDTLDARSQDMAFKLYDFYLRLKPEAADSSAVRAKMEQAGRIRAELESRTSLAEAPAPEPIQPEVKVEPEPAPVAVSEPKPAPKASEANSRVTTVTPALNLTGRWVSTTKAENGREAWILDVKDTGGEYWVSINNKSAVKNTFLFEAMTNLDIPARMEDGKFRFDFRLVEQDPEARGTGLVGNVGNLLGNMLGVDVFEWKLFSNSKEARDLAYEYSFDLDLDTYSMKGYIHTSVRDTANPATAVSSNTQACELFRAPMNYSGMTIPQMTDEEKRQDKAFRDLFSATQKQANTDVKAMNDLGCLYWSGVGTRVNMKKAVECFASAALENTFAQLNLASMYLSGSGVEKDVDKARNWFLLAAEKGYVDAFVLCGDSYIFGSEPENNYNTALFYYEKAIAAGSVFGQYRLGWLYKEGLGVKADRKLALMYLEKAMEAGYTAARVELASLYEDEGNLAKAVVLLKEAASENDTQAILRLSELYLRGEGVEQDFSRAKQMEEKALRADIRLLSGYNTLESTAKQIYERWSE